METAIMKIETFVKDLEKMQDVLNNCNKFFYGKESITINDKDAFLNLLFEFHEQQKIFILWKKSNIKDIARQAAEEAREDGTEEVINNIRKKCHYMTLLARKIRANELQFKMNLEIFNVHELYGI